MDTNLHVRTATEHDLPALADLFAGTVRAVGPQHYNNAEVESWASRADDPERFRNFILRPHTFVAEDATGIVGFSGIEPTGRVPSLYVRHDRVCQGVGSRLLRTVLDHAERHAIAPLDAEATAFSLPLFQRFGFRLVNTEQVSKGGVTFTKYFVEKPAAPVSDQLRNPPPAS